MSARTISLVYLLGALVTFAAAVAVWRRRDADGARKLGLMLFATAGWAVGDAVELYAGTAQLKQFVSQVQYIFIIAVCPSYVEAAMGLAGLGARLMRGVRVAIWSVPLASLVFAWTNDLHHWLWTSITMPDGQTPFATYNYGWWFWVLTAQTYVLMVAATVILLNALRAVGRGFRPAMVVLVAGTALPWIGNAAYNLKLGPWPGLNWLTLTLGVSGWFFWWVVVRGGLLDLVPRVRGALIETMTDGVIVLDRTGTITDSNRAARETLSLDPATLCGIFGVTTLGEAPVEWQGEVEVNVPDGRRWLDVRVGPVFDRWRVLSGRIVVVRDVTAQKRLQHEREALIGELQDALRRVTQLEGLLPVCSACHSVLKDDGDWTSMEKYLASHTPLEFTHGICPDCVTRLYPEVADLPGVPSAPHNGAWPSR